MIFKSDTYYCTRGGNKAYIVAITDNDVDQPILGYLINGDGEKIAVTWGLNGSYFGYGGESSEDLVVEWGCIKDLKCALHTQCALLELYLQSNQYTTRERMYSEIGILKHLINTLPC